MSRIWQDRAGASPYQLEDLRRQYEAMKVRLDPDGEQYKRLDRFRNSVYVAMIHAMYGIDQSTPVNFDDPKVKKYCRVAALFQEAFNFYTPTAHRSPHIFGPQTLNEYFIAAHIMDMVTMLHRNRYLLFGQSIVFQHS
jgi:hypothetical protein